MNKIEYMKKRFITITVLCGISCLSICGITNLNAQNGSITPYQKLFENKRTVKSEKGIITLHNIEGKLYLEIPVKLLGKSFLMSSYVENVSNMTLAYSGQRTSRPIEITFTKTDSLVHIRQIPAPKITDKGDEGIARAIEAASLPYIIGAAAISAYSPDSSAILFEATKFFVSGDKHIGSLNASSFGGLIQKTSTFSKELSLLKDIEAYDDNVAIISDMTYTMKTVIMGLESTEADYLTAELRTTLSLLPQDPYRHRIADYRIGTGVTEFERFSSKEQGLQSSYLATRWRLEPDNPERYRNGELCEPQKPVVFYLDTLFPLTWREAIRRGLTKWNQAFEKIGFKEVIKVYDYPAKAQDPKFSSSNIAYNCVKYAQSPNRNIARQINTDPRTGEILSASILFFLDTPVTLQRERICITAAVEPEVRSYKMTDNLLCNSIELAMTREMGFCLGLTANLAASSWMPTDSLRSPSFTAREGITASVMDQIKYNYIVQPGDIEKGVKLTSENLGVYDYYAIEWLYRPLLFTKTPEQEQFILREMISSKKDDPRYYYGKEQHGSAYFDPRSIVEDLGNDKIKAAQYGINTLKYICANGAKWIDTEEADESYRELFFDFVFLKLYDYYRSLMINVGGIEINRKYEGDSTPTFIPVAKEIQRKTLLYMLEQADDLNWMDNKELLQISGMNQHFSGFSANNLIRLVFQRIPMVAFTQTKSSDPYTVDEMLTDISTFALRNIRQGITPTEAQTATLYTLVSLLISNSNLPKVQSAKNKPVSFAANYEYLATGHEQLTSLKYLTDQNLAPIYYKHLSQLYGALKASVKKASSEKEREKINYLLITVEKAAGKV